MKSLLLAFILLLPARVFPGLPLGSPVPKASLRIKDVSGKEISLQQVREANGLLVMFSCNTCPYVMRNQARTKEVCTYAGQHEIGVVLLNSNASSRDNGNSFADMQSYARTQDYKWYYAIDDDGSLAAAFGASHTPECYLFDKSGVLVYHGAIDDSPADPTQVKRQHLKIAIEEMLAGKPVSVKETRSVGCSIR